jgi:hypothetical protein
VPRPFRTGMLRPRGPYNRHHRLYPWRRSRCQQYNCLISQIASRDGLEKRRPVSTRTQAAHEPFALKVSSVFLHASYIEVSSQVNGLPRVSVCAASMVALTQCGRSLHRSGRSSSSPPLGWHTTTPADPSSDPVRAWAMSSPQIASDLPPPRRPDQILALGALANARPNVLHRQDDGPSTMIGELAHGRGLQWQRLLVVSGDAGIEADALIYTPLPLSLFTVPTYSVLSLAFISRLAGRSRHES